MGKIRSLSSILAVRLMMNVRNPKLLEEASIDLGTSATVETRILFKEPGEGDNQKEIPDRQCGMA